MKIGFIGLGLMGSRIARNILKATGSLTVYNRTKQKAKTLLDEGALWADSPGDVGAKSDIVFTMLSTPDVVKSLATGRDGLLENMRKDSLWIDCSTVNPSFSREMTKEASKRGIHFLDAPVAGTTGPAEKGELVILVGGEEEDVELAHTAFTYFGKKIVHAGANGMGSSLKMVINLMLGQSMIAFAEALSLGKSLGLSQENLLDTLLNGPVTAPYLSGKREKIEKQDFSPEFPLEHMEKDLHLAEQSASENGVPFFSTAIARQLFSLAKCQENSGRKDFSYVLEFIYNNTKRSKGTE